MDKAEMVRITGHPAPIPVLYCVECFGGFDDNKDNPTGELVYQGDSLCCKHFEGKVHKEVE